MPQTTPQAHYLTNSDGKEIVICYTSHVLMKSQRKYCTARKEHLAMMKLCRQFVKQMIYGTN